MTNIRDIMDKEQLEREFKSIRRVFATLKEEEKPLRIEWGTKQAFEARKCGDTVKENFNCMFSTGGYCSLTRNPSANCSGDTECRKRCPLWNFHFIQRFNFGAYSGGNP